MKGAVVSHVKIATVKGAIPEASIGTNSFSYHFLILVYLLQGYNTAASLIYDLLFERFNMTYFLLPNKTLNLRFYQGLTQPCINDHLQPCTIHFHIVFSYQYNHDCKATTQQLH